MHMGVKYCGGCNPHYERGALVRRAMAEYPHVVFEPYSETAHYDGVLLVCGCLEECFTFTCTNSAHGIVAVRLPEEYPKLEAFLRTAGGL